MYNLVYHTNYEETINQLTPFSFFAKSESDVYLNSFYQFECLPTIPLLYRPIIRCKPYFFFFTNLPKIKMLFQIKNPINKIQLTHISIKEWNFLVARSVSLNILIIVVVIWFPSKKSSNSLPDFAHSLLSLLTKLVERSSSENCVFNFVVFVVVVIVSIVSVQTRVSQGLISIDVAETWRKHIQYSLWWKQKLNC